MSDLGVRTAARKEAEQLTIDPNESDPLPGDHHTMGWRLGFEWGAVWAAVRLPTRDEIAALAEEHSQCINWGTEEHENACWCGWDGDETESFEQHFADAVLALIQSSMTT